LAGNLLVRGALSTLPENHQSEEDRQQDSRGDVENQGEDAAAGDENGCTHTRNDGHDERQQKQRDKKFVGLLGEVEYLPELLDAAGLFLRGILFRHDAYSPGDGVR